MCVPNILIAEGPDYDRVAYEHYLDMKLAPDGDPEKPPTKAPKDWWVRIGILAGVVAGAVPGAVIGARHRELSPGDVMLVGMFVGGIIGLVVGAICGVVGSYIYSRLRS